MPAIDWLSFEEAGKLIDGENGWKCDDGARPSAQSLLMLAHKGKVAVKAVSWELRTRHSARASLIHGLPGDDDKADFLQMLLVREKLQNDSWHSQVAVGILVQGAFTLADDRAGNFDVIRKLTLPNGFTVSSHFVVGLRFCLADIREQFGLDTEMTEASPKVKGRPKGRGGWAAMDAPLLAKMRKMIAKNPGMTAHNAASHFVDEAAGGATIASKQRRLADKYSETYRD